MLGRPLNFTPGTQTHYSNLGFCVLSDVVAHVTGLTYAQAADKMLFRPFGMTHTHLATSLRASFPGEVHYYGQGAEASGPQSPYQLPLAAASGAAGWVSTVGDLERFLVATAAPVPGSVAFPTWPASMVGNDSPAPAEQSPTPPGQGTWWNSDGSLPGVSTETGVFGPIAYVMLANSRNPAAFTDFSPLQDLAKRSTSLPASAWPTGNLLVPPARSLGHAGRGA